MHTYGDSNHDISAINSGIRPTGATGFLGCLKTSNKATTKTPLHTANFISALLAESLDMLRHRQCQHDHGRQAANRFHRPATHPHPHRTRPVGQNRTVGSGNRSPQVLVNLVVLHTKNDLSSLYTVRRGGRLTLMRRGRPTRLVTIVVDAVG